MKKLLFSLSVGVLMAISACAFADNTVNIAEYSGYQVYEYDIVTIDDAVLERQVTVRQPSLNENAGDKSELAAILAKNRTMSKGRSNPKFMVDGESSSADGFRVVGIIRYFHDH